MIDTEAKRYSALNFADSSPILFEPPSGVFPRFTSIGLYSGIQAANIPTSDGVACPGLIDITDELRVKRIC